MQIIKKIISYILSLGIIFLLLKYTYKDVSIKELISQIKQLNFTWLVVAMLLGLVSHLVRAYRWVLLFQPLGFKVDLLKSFVALMIGYMANLFIPRLGEIVRCSVLSRTTAIPIGFLLGTVGIERVIDLLGFLVVIALTLFFTYPEITSTLSIVFSSPLNQKFVFYSLIGFIILLGVVAMFAYYGYKRSKQHKLLRKLGSFMLRVKQGFYAIRASQVKKYIVYTTIIKWGLYYLSDYLGVFAIPATAHLDWSVGLAVLMMSSLSFAAPIQGAIGAYHILVSSTLVGYGTTYKDALLYATVIHAAHLLVIIIGGVLGIILQHIWVVRSKR